MLDWEGDVRVELSLTARVEVVRHRSFSVAVRWQLRLGYSIHVDRALGESSSSDSELMWSNTTCRYAFSWEYAAAAAVEAARVVCTVVVSMYD